jgi:hypothetical protein
MSQNPESVPFVRRTLQISQPDELWFTLAGRAAVANRCSYSICFTWVRQAPINDLVSPILGGNPKEETSKQMVTDVKQAKRNICNDWIEQEHRLWYYGYT